MAVSPVEVFPVKGMGGKVYDFRGTGLCPPAMPNGKPVKIKPLIAVEHIPVVRNVPGIGDFVSLANVLRVQGLSLQSATDSEGNVCRYTHLDQLCWQARGGNVLSCGTEHMHLTIGEPWGEKQMRAAAWLAVLALERQGIPLNNGTLISGPGVVKVKQRGHVGHAYVSRAAGFNDRIDPGPGFDRQHMYELARFFLKHRRF